MAAQTITGEAGSEIAQPLTFGTLIDGTTISSVVLRALAPDGQLHSWPTSLEAMTATTGRAVFAIPAQLARGAWKVRPFVYVAGALVTSIRFRTAPFTVTPDPISAP